MTSLSEAYGGHSGGTDLRRLYAGVGLFVAGTLALGTAIVITTTSVYVGGETTMTDARHLGGILGGLGLPAIFLGVFTVLPSSRRTKAAAGIGAAIAILGVGLFWHAYPCQWVGSNCGEGLMDLTLPTAGTYFFGALTTFWCLFAGVANFKTRNDPGGTARVDVTTKGETEIVEVERNRGFGSLGFLGSTPDGDVETQTAGATDGGASTADLSSPLDDKPRAGTAGSGSGASAWSGTDARTGSGANARTGSGANARTGSRASRTRSPSGTSGDGVPADTYCGNCRHFEYVRTDQGIQPYCGADQRLMENMDACEQWSPRH